ncbi:MAG TPA: hypothetical protein VJQ53_08025 [Candidatus Eisenbacteria bacterium]|nr:hypothetical protein [Candidatus Eisenbacteria bacterium]
MPRLVAIYRKPAYSPLQHLANDTAILDAVVARLGESGWDADRLQEAEVENGRIPAASLYLNMAQGPLASELLAPLELDGAVVANRPSSVLQCHRHRLVRALAEARVSFPQTLIIPTMGPPPTPAVIDALAGGGGQVWVKRGDVHAERPEDVICVPPEQVASAVRAFSQRAVPWVALQRHVPGPVYKFYAVADGRLFRWYDSAGGPDSAGPPLDGAKLRNLVFRAAAAVALDVFGGDVAMPSPDNPVLIDLNDWPSFAPFREAAAIAIADHVQRRTQERKELE